MRRISDLPTLAEMQARPRATPKTATPTRKARKAKTKREAVKVVKSVRGQCDERDGYCRGLLPVPGDTWEGPPHRCSGPSEWAHLGEKVRARTVNQPPEERHTTAGSAKMCKGLHDRYDGRARPRVNADPITDRGANGPMRFTKGAK